MKNRNLTGGALSRRNALAVALAVGLGFSGLAMGQATTGAIFGNAPSGAGQTIRVTGSGVNRTVTVGSDGRYSVGNLPVGTYTVTLSKNGTAVSKQSNVDITVGAGTEVDFGSASTASTTKLGAVQVQANQLPSIDVTSVSTSYTVTSQQLEQLPVGRNAESIALLAPGVISASGYFGNVLSIAGAGATENAYYVNGYNTTNLYNYTGASYQLPYGSIAQQETLTGGYSAKYGRSDGGVLNQVGKRGTDEWHFGAQVVWAPRFAASNPVNEYYPNITLGPNEQFVSQQVKPGDLRRYRAANKSWQTEYDAYISGPLIKDKLFFFLSAAQTKSSHRNVLGVGSNEDDYYKNRNLRWYGKVDWNINDNNILEFTELKQVEKNGYGQAFQFNNKTLTDGPALGGGLSYLDYHYDTKIFHYTSYISDAATLSVLYGYSNATNPTLVPNPSPLPRIVGSVNQDPAITGGTNITNAQTTGVINSPDASEKSKNLRVDFSYQLGHHLIEAGIDNVHYAASDQGRRYSGPGYIWYYLNGKPTDPINSTLGVGAPGGNGYYVDQVIFNSVTRMSADQKAYYIQDKWQLTPNLLLSLGIRNDEFTNSNASGVKFVDEKNQWEPRLGFSWDVNGDSSFKIYGNVGRYYLALPQAVAERTASGATFTDNYFTYTGIDSNGIPTGLTPVQGTNGAPPPGPVSANNEFGQAPDPATVTATNLKAQYQDEYILGFDKTLGPKWTYGAKLTYRQLSTVIDDICDPYKLRDKLTAMGLNAADYKWGDPYCRLSNPGSTNIYKVNKVGGGSINLAMTNADYGTFPQPKRRYYGLDMYLEHPFDGVWMGRVDYTFSRNYGNTEGQVRSDFGQTDISVTEDWDYVQLMSGAGGRLMNDRTHQLKAYGAWQVAPDWLVSGTLRVQSGTPQECLGLYGPNQTDPGAGYGGGSYHWCNGKVSPPGSVGNTPWTETIDLGVTYRPSFADHKLAFKMNVFNLLNQQRTLQTDPQLRVNNSPTTVNNTYHAGLFYQTPRYVRFSVSYDY